MANELYIGHLFTPKQLVGVRAEGEDYLAEVQEGDTTAYKLLVHYPPGEEDQRDYTALLHITKLIAYKGLAKQNSSVECDILIATQTEEGIELMVAVSSDVTVAQLRAFVRLDITLPVQITGVDPRTNFYGPPIKTQTIDISAGGMRCLCPQLYDLQSEVDLELKYRAGAAQAKGRVLRRSIVSQSMFEYAITFNTLDEKNKRLIEEFCEDLVQD